MYTVYTIYTYTQYLYHLLQSTFDKLTLHILRRRCFCNASKKYSSFKLTCIFNVLHCLLHNNILSIFK